MAERKSITLSVPELSPDSLPVSASLSFPRGALSDAKCLRVLDGEDRVLPSQARSLLAWPDASAHAALLVFDPRGAVPPFRVVIGEAQPAAEEPLARAVEGGVLIDTGLVTLPLSAPPLDIDERDRGILTDLHLTDSAVTGRA
jgi:hypothetical protein